MQQSSKNIPLICHGHSRPVPHLSYSNITEDGFFLISACLDGKPMLRHGQTGDWVGTFLGHKGAVWSAVFNHDALLAATGSADYTCKIWDALSGECKQSFEHKRIVKTVNFSMDSQKLLSGGQEKLIRIFDLGKPDAAPQVLEGHTQPIKMSLWQSQTVILSGGQDNCIRVFDIRDGKEAKNMPMKGPVSSLEIRSGVLTVAAGKEVVFLDALTFAPIRSYTLPFEVNTAALHPTRTRFIAGGASDFWDHVYEYDTGKEIETHKGHHGPVHCVKYAPDGETFASGSEDGTIRLIQNEVKVYGLWQVPADDTPPAE
jgi:serine-threonine kinase receptor-associated protein